MVWFPNSRFYLSGRKCIVAMFSCFKTKSEKKKLPREVYLLAPCLMLNWSQRHTRLYMPQNMKSMGFLQFFESFRGKIYKKYPNCRQYCFDLLGLISAVLMSRMGVKLKKPPQMSHTCGTSKPCQSAQTSELARNEEWIEFETATITSDCVVHNHLSIS